MPILLRPRWPAPGRQCRVALASAVLAFLSCPAWGATASLNRGAPVYLELVEPLSSERAVPGTPLELRVAFDVRSSGAVLVERGAPARGSILEASAAGFVGKAGTVVIRPESCTAVDGTVVLLDGEHRVRGAEYFEESVAIAGMVCCLGVFLRGQKAVAPEKTVIASTVSKTALIEVESSGAEGAQ